MKVAFTVFVLFLFAYGQAKIVFNIYEDECIEQLSANREEIAAAFGQNFFPEDDEEFKDVFACAWRKEGIIDEEDNIVLENLRKFLVNNFIKAQGSNYLISVLVAADTMHHCENVRGETVGDTAVKISNCILRRLDSYDD